MSREVKRVPIGFDWPIRKVWWGYILEPVRCEYCNGTGKESQKHIMGFLNVDGSIRVTWESDGCPCCDGEGACYHKVEVPQGPGFQMWETTTEGSPMSPAFATPEELAKWLVENNAGAFGYETATYEQWLAMIKKGWAPSMVQGPDGLKSGVEAVSDGL
jgi:hypothetical protein